MRTARNPVISEEEIEDRQIRSFNFRRPEIVSRDQLRALEQRLEAFCRGASTVLSQYTQKPVEVTLQRVRNTVYSALFEKSPDAGVRTQHLYGFFRTSAGGGLPGLVSMSRDLFYGLVECLMGGMGYTPQGARPLTDFERRLLVDIGNRLLKRMADTVEEVIPLEPDVQVIQEEPRLLPRVFAAQDAFLQMTYDIDLEDCRGYLTVSLPFKVLRPHLPKLKALPVQAKANSLREEDLQRFNDFETLPLELVAEMAPIDVTLATLLRLKAGDVVPVSSRAVRDVLVRVDDNPCFVGHPGLLGERMVVEVTHLVEKEGPRGDVCWSV